MGVEPLIALPPRVLVRLGSSAVPLVRVCAAGMGSVRSWRTWRAAQASYLRLDMLKKRADFSCGWGNLAIHSARIAPPVVVCASSARPKLPAARWRDGDAL